MHRAIATSVAVALLLPAAAHGAETTITVGNDFFQPANVQVSVGDTVSWVFEESGNHNIQSRAGEEESFDSDPGTPESLIRHDAGYKFSYTFNKDNVAVDYLCRVHPATMTGTVSVGSPPVDGDPPVVSAAKAKVEGKRVAISFGLDEAAKVTVRIARASKPKRTLRTASKQLQAGDRAIRVARRGLAPGRYVAKLTAEDDAGNESSVRRASFRLRPRRGG